MQHHVYDLLNSSEYMGAKAGANLRLARVLAGIRTAKGQVVDPTKLAKLLIGKKSITGTVNHTPFKQDDEAELIKAIQQGVEKGKKEGFKTRVNGHTGSPEEIAHKMVTENYNSENKGNQKKGKEGGEKTGNNNNKQKKQDNKKEKKKKRKQRAVFRENDLANLSTMNPLNEKSKIRKMTVLGFLEKCIITPPLAKFEKRAGPFSIDMYDRTKILRRVSCDGTDMSRFRISTQFCHEVHEKCLSIIENSKTANIAAQVLKGIKTGLGDVDFLKFEAGIAAKIDRNFLGAKHLNRKVEGANDIDFIRVDNLKPYMTNVGNTWQKKIDAWTPMESFRYNYKRQLATHVNLFAGGSKTKMPNDFTDFLTLQTWSHPELTIDRYFVTRVTQEAAAFNDTAKGAAYLAMLKSISDNPEKSKPIRTLAMDTVRITLQMELENYVYEILKTTCLLIKGRFTALLLSKFQNIIQGIWGFDQSTPYTKAEYGYAEILTELDTILTAVKGDKHDYSIGIATVLQQPVTPGSPMAIKDLIVNPFLNKQAPQQREMWNRLLGTVEPVALQKIAINEYKHTRPHVAPTYLKGSDEQKFFNSILPVVREYMIEKASLTKSGANNPAFLGAQPNLVYRFKNDVMAYFRALRTTTYHAKNKTFSYQAANAYGIFNWPVTATRLSGAPSEFLTGKDIQPGEYLVSYNTELKRAFGSSTTGSIVWDNLTNFITEKKTVFTNKTTEVDAAKAEKKIAIQAARTAFPTPDKTTVTRDKVEDGDEDMDPEQPAPANAYSSRAATAGVENTGDSDMASTAPQYSYEDDSVSSL